MSVTPLFTMVSGTYADFLIMNRDSILEYVWMKKCKKRSFLYIPNQF